VPHLELEVPLNRDDSHYLFYTIPTKAGYNIPSAVRFFQGEIYEVSDYLPTEETMKKVGTFTLKPVIQRPIIDRNLNC
jgi:hypothetical protein